MGSDGLEDVVAQLESISEMLGDRVVSLLRDAVAEGSRQRPPEEKAITQARRAVDKAIHLLSSPRVTND